MTTTLILAAALFVSGSITNQAASYPATAPRLTDGVMVVNLAAADRATRESCGWFALTDEPPTAPAGYYAAPIGYAPNADGFYRVYTIAPLPPAPPRKFSKLKIYGAIVSLPDANGVSAWECVKAWLEAKTIQGVNGWMAFQLAQEVSEDHPLFASLAEEARQLLGLSEEQFDALLNACILED